MSRIILRPVRRLPARIWANPDIRWEIMAFQRVAVAAGLGAIWCNLHYGVSPWQPFWIVLSGTAIVYALGRVIMRLIDWPPRRRK